MKAVHYKNIWLFIISIQRIISSNMNYTKSKDKQSYHNDDKNPRTFSNKFSYSVNVGAYSKSYQKNKRGDQKDRANIRNMMDSVQESKQNESLFKNIQKCNEQKQFYKLKGSLQEQKRSMLEQENYFLKTENEQLKTQLQNFKKQIKRLSKKVEKLSHQIQKYQVQQDDLRIDIPNRFKQIQNSKAFPTHNEERVQFCQKCIQLSSRLQQERDLYERDRKYLKEQIDSLNENLDDAKRQQKNLKKELEGKKSFPEQKQLEIIQKFKNKQNQLKKQLTLCYQAFEQKCKVISELEQKIDYFEQQNQRILKLLTLFDENYRSKNQSLKNNDINTLKKQENSSVSYYTKSRKFSNLRLGAEKINMNDTFNDDSYLQSRGKNRKCGSIKKVQIE